MKVEAYPPSGSVPSPDLTNLYKQKADLEELIRTLERYIRLRTSREVERLVAKARSAKA